MYQALYRKWRPKTFSEVTGQEHITKTLKSEISSGRVSHAYLFVGSRGTGKTTCAKIFAKAINCLSAVDGDPCGNCKICKEIQNENALDIVEIDAASNNSVENIRSMREEVVFTPAKCKYRVYIVDEVHMLSTGAFNAFLKILEEPPEHVIFILATTEIHKLPATIISRCQRFDFHRISEEDIMDRINFVCQEENIKIEPDAAKIIAKSSDGGMRDALSILDQCANSCENNITLEATQKILGISGGEYTKKFAENILNGNCLESLDLLDQMHQESKNMRKLCEELMEHFRALMVESLKNVKNCIPLDRAIEILSTFQNAHKNMGVGANPKLEMEIAFAKLCSNTATEQPKKAVKMLPKAKAPEKISLSPTGSFEKWSEILEKLKETGTLKSLYIALKDSNAYQNENFILIDSNNSLAFELLRNSDYRIAIKKIIKEVTGKQYSLGPYKPEKDENQKPKQDSLDSLIETAEKNGINISFN